MSSNRAPSLKSAGVPTLVLHPWHLLAMALLVLGRRCPLILFGQMLKGRAACARESFVWAIRELRRHLERRDTLHLLFVDPVCSFGGWQVLWQAGWSGAELHQVGEGGGPVELARSSGLSGWLGLPGVDLPIDYNQLHSTLQGSLISAIKYKSKFQSSLLTSPFIY